MGFPRRVQTKPLVSSRLQTKNLSNRVELDASYLRAPRGARGDGEVSAPAVRGLPPRGARGGGEGGFTGRSARRRECLCLDGWVRRGKCQHISHRGASRETRRARCRGFGGARRARVAEARGLARARRRGRGPAPPGPRRLRAGRGAGGRGGRRRARLPRRGRFPEAPRVVVRGGAERVARPGRRGKRNF